MYSIDIRVKMCLKGQFKTQEKTNFYSNPLFREQWISL